MAPALVACWLLAGCQRYQPRPLNIVEHHEQWTDRSPHSEMVADFGRRIDAAAPAAVATPFDASDGLALPEAELVALVFNPDLRLARLRAGVARATAEEAGHWDDPELAVDVLRITESVASPWVITPGLALTIPISGRLGAEKARADAALRAELDRVAEAEWRLRQDVRSAWIKWASAALRAEETMRFIDSMDSLVASTGALADAGEMARPEAALFLIEQSQRRQEVIRLEGEIADGEQRLRMLLGLSPSAPLALDPALPAGSWLDGAEPAPGPHGLESNLTLARLRDEYEIAEQTLRREIRKQYPDLTIGPLYETDQGQSRIGFLGAIPVPLLNANRQGIAEARAGRELARAAFETGYEQLAGALAVVQCRARTLHAQRAELESVIAPLVDRQAADARRLLELGEGSGLVLLESLVRALETKLTFVDVRRDIALASAELAFLLGPRREVQR